MITSEIRNSSPNIVAACCSELIPIGAERAISIARQEVERRNITLTRGYIVNVVEDTFIAEAGPDVPVYMIEFNDPHRVRPIPLYDVELDRYTG